MYISHYTGITTIPETKINLVDKINKLALPNIVNLDPVVVEVNIWKWRRCGNFNFISFLHAHIDQFEIQRGRFPFLKIKILPVSLKSQAQFWPIPGSFTVNAYQVPPATQCIVKFS